MTMLESRRLTKTFQDGTRAFTDVSVCFAAGEMTAIVGPSGSGKSTLLLCLAGILRVDSGSVLFAGRHLESLSEPDLATLRRGQFGFIFQLGLLVGELSSLKNVALPLLLRGWPADVADREAHTVLSDLGLGDLQNKRPNQISVGQAQRVAVARALVGSPDIIFADEPTGSLDSENGNIVFRALQAAVGAGRTVVLVTHDERLAQQADRTYVISDGRLVRP